ncbi:hypothetical protein [Desertivirga arenae]|uniref:hypothetical protein n=1 Tax=Desertivirga arenae TaxID=2810309 RepID=UPI001A96B5DF|nr:hypothetical protein [Pedobacter sp. SYSU D00823]
MMTKIFIPATCFLIMLLFASMGVPSEPVHYTDYRPILLSRESLERSITLLAAREIKSPAKIYYKDKYIFISENYKGVHIIDNQDPTNPKNISFISVPGCVDMAIKGNALYVDNATDLAVVDLENIKTSGIKVTKRIKDAFPEIVPPDGYQIPEKYSLSNRPANTVVVEWVK